MNRRNTWQKAAVLTALADADLHGLAICKATGLKSGTVYPILVRFQEDGLVRSRWENIDPRKEKRPRRRYYALTRKGRQSILVA